MKIAVMNFTKVRANGLLASDRIATYIARQTGADLLDREERVRRLDYDMVFIVNGVPKFCSWMQVYQAICERCRRFAFIGNDYKLTLPGNLRFIKDREFHLLAAYENTHGLANYRYVNWNALTFQQNRPLIPKLYRGLSYYGAYRDGRKIYFQRYLGGYKGSVFISTSPRNRVKFAAINKSAHFFSMRDVIGEYGAFTDTVYIEDVFTHKHYCSPANRFYECLSAGVMIHFDVNTAGTFLKAGIDVSPWIVSSAEDIKCGNASELKRQRERLYDGMDYKEEMDSQFGAFIDEVMK